MSVEFTLVVLADGTERRVPAVAGPDAPYTIGRGADAKLFLNHATVSRAHARIVARDARLFVEDAGSQIGTRLNDVRIAGATELHDGDRLTVGDVTLRISLAVPEEVVRVRAQALATLRPGAIRGAKKITKPDATAADSGSPDRTILGGVAAPSVVTTVSVSLEGREKTTLGRDEASDVALDSPLLSRRHAEVRRDGDGYVVADLDSTNGTFVNGTKVGTPRRLVKGDQLRVGPYTFVFEGTSLAARPVAEGTRIEVRSVGKEVNDRATGKPIYLLKDVSLTIQPKEFVGLLGSSGCGKSTFMDTVNGRRPATEGTVLFNGENLYNRFDAFKQGIGYVPQELIFHDGLPVAAALRYASRLRLPDDTSDAEIEANIDRVLAIVGLVAQRETLVKHLSGGQKKRVSIAMELLSRPTVLFLDEATSGLDLGTEAQMMRLFRDLADGGVTTLCITHYVDSLDNCDVVAYFIKGRLAFYGSPSELKKHFGVAAIREVYVKETEKSPDEWEALFRKSAAYRAFVENRASREAPSDATTLKPGQGMEQVRKKDPKRQFEVLTKRYVELIKGDRRALWITVGMAPVVGLLASLVFRKPDVEQLFQEAARQNKLAFLLTISSVFMGLFGAIREVVKELNVFRHERFANLEILPYLASKVVPLAILAAMQTAGLLIVVHTFLDVEASFFGQFTFLWLGSVAAGLLGLAISSAADTSDKAVMLMFVVVIPQFLFSNVIMQLSGFTSFLGMAFIVSYWCQDGLKSLLPDRLLEARLGGGQPQFSQDEFGNVHVTAGSDGALVLFGHHGWFLDFVMLLVFIAMYGALAYHFLRKKDGPTGKPYQIPWIKSGTWVVVGARLKWAGNLALTLLARGVGALGRKLAALGDKTGPGPSAPPPASGAPPKV